MAHGKKSILLILHNVHALTRMEQFMETACEQFNPYTYGNIMPLKKNKKTKLSIVQLLPGYIKNRKFYVFCL